MEPFTTLAGLVGFIASFNGVIGLCERALSLLDHVRHTKELDVERARVVTICGVYQKLKEKLELEKGAFGETDLESLRLSTLVVHKRLTEIIPKLQPSVVISQKKIIKKKLGEIGCVLEPCVWLLHLETRPATDQLSNVACATSSQIENERSDVVANFLEENKLLQRLRNPNNSKVIPKSSLRKQDWYTDILEVKPDNARLIVLEDKMYMVERIALGKTPKETERRLSRLGKLLVILRECEDEGISSLLRMSKIVRGPETFFILSELEDARYAVLEEMLPELKDDQGWKVLLRIAEAVENLHKLSLVHEGLNSHNILVHRDSTEIKLTGFAYSREILDLSDSLTTEDPDLQKRNQIFQAPERFAGSRYSFECDVYSLGMLMLEVYLGRPLVHEPSREPSTGKDYIISSLEQPSRLLGEQIKTEVVVLIKDILQAKTASKRPLALEISERLSRMGSPTSNY